MKKYIYWLIASCILLCTACEKFIEIASPKNLLTVDKVFADTTSLKAALQNIYVVLERQQYVSCNKYLAVYADEALSTNLQEWNQSRISPSESTNRGNWSNLYAVIYQCNMLLEQTDLSNKVPLNFRQQVRAEAFFLRAYAYFYLVNLFDRVPLLTQTDVAINRSALQANAAAIYQQIIADLSEARKTISISYLDANRQRVNKAAVTALLAKVYLYQKEWALAESLATELIADVRFQSLELPSKVFASNSKETILQFGTQNGMVAEASGLIPTTGTSIPAYYFTESFYQSFEANDLRKTTWIGTNTVTANGVSTSYRYPLKYKNRVANTTSPENLIVFRIAEQYLIRAEARAQQNKLLGADGGLIDVNVIRNRANLPPLVIADQATLLAAIANERRHELFFENADRFFELKRTGMLQTVMQQAKPTWQNYGKNLPIPLADLIANHNLVQNEGY